MNYIFYFISFFLLFIGLILFLNPKKANRIIHVLIYLFPFWASGLILLTSSLIIWQFKLESKNNLINSIFSFFILIIGLILTFFPKRKIKKNFEKWENLPIEVKKIYSIIFIIFSFLVYSITI